MLVEPRGCGSRFLNKMRSYFGQMILELFVGNLAASCFEACYGGFRVTSPFRPFEQQMYLPVAKIENTDV